MTSSGRQNNAYQHYDETTLTQIKNGYEVICFG
jgi:hypothetical protein